MDTIDYYNKNAKKYYDRTKEINLEDTWNKFISYLPERAEILDVGCGSGRDSRYFVEQGFDVTALDASKELCKLASIHIGQEVLHLKISELNFKEVFDGVWACDSLVHNTLSELEETMKRIINCMKPHGILYMSFKYGDFCGERNDRYYIDFNTRKMKDFLLKYHGISLVEIWKNSDVRAGREADLWLNVLVKKIR
ncbi:class I SAM-dependent methyltransferase [Lacrimispora defluvii]|uniref:Class I SAM-dependent methyltransferase n=1 Tax=Lacrimispora defluvii TaxID=2719233 RepID=A0ABX1VUD1_9FIRM|nr:class I SAM-dependent methyltransferase [Lacrimispora defluvii]NNJ32053.1 class I SAM-dependent methyltransferase [Lacrimispora defluvii]